MTRSRKALVGLAATVALLSGCAIDPYHDRYAYYDGTYDRPVTRYYEYDPLYYPGYYPRYYGPTLGFSFSYSNRDRYWRHH